MDAEGGQTAALGVHLGTSPAHARLALFTSWHAAASVRGRRVWRLAAPGGSPPLRPSVAGSRSGQQGGGLLSPRSAGRAGRAARTRRGGPTWWSNAPARSAV